MVSAIFQRSVDLSTSQQLHMIHMLCHVIQSMCTNIHTEHKARAEAARHASMQLVPVKYRPWLGPLPGPGLTWQRFSMAVPWGPIAMVLVSLAHWLAPFLHTVKSKLCLGLCPYVVMQTLSSLSQLCLYMMCFVKWTNNARCSIYELQPCGSSASLICRDAEDRPF